jgi:hypothetical protein
LLLLAACCTGCGHIPSDPAKARVAEASQLPSKVAVLPFVNRTSSPEASAVVRKMFYNFFSSLNYYDLEPTLIDARLKKKGLYDPILAEDPVSLQRIGQILGADAVVTGQILDYGKAYALVYAHTSIRLRASMIDCASGRTIWDIEHETRVREGDVPFSLTGMAGALIKTAISYNQASLLQTAAKLCLDVIQTVPNPEGLADPPPEIRYLVHNGGNQLLKPGEQLKVILAGDPNLKATWDIAPLVSDLPMQEREAGIYVGSYQVRPGDKLAFGRIVGRLENRQGAARQWVDVLGPVALGRPTPLPASFTEDTVLTKNESPYLAAHPVIVPSRVTLTIHPGSVVWFKKYGLGVQGELHILGTPEAPVRIYGLGTSAWKGIILDGAAGKNAVSYCRISGAEFGLRAYASHIRLDHCLLTDNTWNLVLEESSCSLEQSLLRSAQKTGVSLRDCEAEIKQCLIVDNKNGGLFLERTRLNLAESSLYNNGSYDLKAEATGPNEVAAEMNWWGTAKEEALRVQGDIPVQPLLDSPPRFDFVKLWMNEPL